MKRLLFIMFLTVFGLCYGQRQSSFQVWDILDTVAPYRFNSVDKELAWFKPKIVKSYQYINGSELRMVIDTIPPRASRKEYMERLESMKPTLKFFVKWGDGSYGWYSRDEFLYKWLTGKEPVRW